MSRWPMVRLKLVARLGTGHTPSRLHPEYWENCTIPWLTLADVWQIRDDTLQVVSETAELISEVGLANSAAVLHPAGTVVLSRTASVGFSGILGIDMATSQDYVTWTCGPKLLPRFVLYALRGLRDEILGRRMGSTHQTIYMPDVEQIAIPLPPLPAQRAIADYLDAETARIDALIARKRRMIELLEERLAELVATAVTQGLHPSERLAKGPDWVARAPTTWEVWPLGRLVRMVSGGTPNKDTERFWNGEVPWASPKDMKRFRLADTEDHVSNEAVTVAGLKVVPAGTVLVVVRGMILAHSFPVAITMEPMTINQDMKALLPTPRVHPEFLAYLLVGLKSVMLSFVEEAAHGTRKLATEVWSKLPVAIPAIAEQKAIVRNLETEAVYVAKTTSRLERQIALVIDRRQALVTAAVTGELAVPGAVA